MTNNASPPTETKGLMMQRECGAMQKSTKVRMWGATYTVRSKIQAILWPKFHTLHTVFFLIASKIFIICAHVIYFCKIRLMEILN